MLMLTSVRSLQTKFKELIPGNYIYYLDTTQFINSEHTDFDIDFIASRSKHDLHVFDLSDEPWRETMAERLDELCKRFKLEKYLILSHSLKYNQNYSYPNIIYFPHNYFDPVLHWKETDALKSLNTFNRPYFASCLNRQPRIPRIYNYLNLVHRSYREELILSIFNFN